MRHTFSTRFLTAGLLVLAALWLVPLAAAGNGNGQATAPGQAKQGQTTSGTSGDPTQPQPLSNADQNSGGANGQCPGGPYCSTRDGSPSQNGNGNGQANGKPCAGCVGKADNKNPQGQMPNGSDANNGYECDGNNGVGKTNPAHTGCSQSPPPCTANCTPPPPCTANCTPPPACTVNCTPTPPCQTNCTPPPACKTNCTPPPACKANCTPPPPCKANCTPPPVKKCGQAGMPQCPKPPVKHHPKPKHKKPVSCPKGMAKKHGHCKDVGIQVPHQCICRSSLRIVVRAHRGRLVTVKGAGLNRRYHVGRSGRLVIKVKPRKQGILVVRAGSLVKRVGITCAPQGAQLTG